MLRRNGCLNPVTQVFINKIGVKYFYPTEVLVSRKKIEEIRAATKVNLGLRRN